MLGPGVMQGVISSEHKILCRDSKLDGNTQSTSQDHEQSNDVLGLFGAGSTSVWRGLAEGRTLILPASAGSGQLHLLINDTARALPRHYRSDNGLKVL